MEEYYYNDDIAFSKRKIIDGSVDNQIKDFALQLNLFRDEIHFWFKLFENCDRLEEKQYLKKPICIELFEYCNYLKWFKNLLNNSAEHINKIFKKTRNQSPIDKLNTVINKVLNDVEKYLLEPRRKFAAHRYTHQSKDFLTINEITTIVNKISNKNLTKIKDDLFKCHDEIVNWININKNYFVILNQK